MIVNDKMQSGYEYDYTEPMGENFSKDFSPQLTPAEMLEFGIFEGHYLSDCRKEFPSEWFKNAKISPDFSDISLNKFCLTHFSKSIEAT